MTMELTAFHKEIAALVDRGFCPIPIPYGSKKPTFVGWPTLKIETGTIPNFFPRKSNVGIVLGETSGGVVDIDIDSDAAIIAADLFLPPTNAVYGRKSRQRSHRLYVPNAQINFEVYRLNEVLIEIRTSARVDGVFRAHQSVVPPSFHADSKEYYEWENAGDPAKVDLKLLRRAVTLTAIAAGLACAHPPFDKEHAAERQDYRLAVTGMLAKHFTQETASDIFLTSLQGAGDLRASEHLSLLDSTFTKLRQNSSARVPGTRAFKSFVTKKCGENAAATLAAWIDRISEVNQQRQDSAQSYESANDGARDSALRCVDVTKFVLRDLPRRQMLLEPFLQEKSIGMIHAWRGVGKTHLLLGIGVALASGGEFLRWRAPEPVAVLHVDGEMMDADLQEWLREALYGVKVREDFFRMIASDLQELTLPSLSVPAGQKLIEAHIGNSKVIIFDNVSSLFRGGTENADDDWAGSQEWLLTLRRNGVATILGHHDGKSRSQRGTSKREDPMNWVIQLRRPKDYDPSEGLRAEVHFEKARKLVGSHDLTGLIQSSWSERESLTRRTGHADEEIQAGADRRAAAAD